MSLTPRPPRPALYRFVPGFFLLASGTFFPPHPLFAAAPKVHTVTLGPFRRVPYTQPDATPDTKADETSTLKVRPLFVDDRQKEWTTGEIHDVTVLVIVGESMILVTPEREFQLGVVGAGQRIVRELDGKRVLNATVVNAAD